jgi:hypothetical protein
MSDDPKSIRQRLEAAGWTVSRIVQSSDRPQNPWIASAISLPFPYDQEQHRIACGGSPAEALVALAEKCGV